MRSNRAGCTMSKATPIKRLERNTEEAVFLGVCAGLADYFGLDVVVIRLIWVFLLVPGGLPGFIPYLLLWLIMPPKRG